MSDDAFLGEFRGSMTLFLEPPPTEGQASESTASVTMVAGGFLTMRYTWAFEGQPQDGLLLFSRGTASATAAWVDSFHQSGSVMQLAGTTELDGVTSVLGSYPAPPGPDWGWRISLAAGGDALVLRMFNVTPTGEEAPAVVAEYRRV